MKKESYLSKPQDIELHKVKNGIDIILRREITEAEKTEEDGTVTKCFECEEIQYRFKGTVTEEKVSTNFEYYWAIAEGDSEEEAIDKEAQELGEPSTLERLEALEAGLAEMAEVMFNG